VYCLCPITLNQKLLHTFKTWYKFSNHVQAKSHKNKTRPACTENFETKSSTTLLWSWDYITTEIIKIEFVCWHKLNETSSCSRQLSILWYHGLNSNSNTRVLVNIITFLRVLRTVTVTICLRSIRYISTLETQMVHVINVSSKNSRQSKPPKQFLTWPLDDCSWEGVCAFTRY
jgi:hypothetical protein